MKQQILCFPTTEAWVEGAVERIVVRLRAAIAARRRATILLAGGSTPAPIHRALAQRADVDWGYVHFFWGDERPVPPDHADSNFRMARETLLEPLGIAQDDPRVHRVPTEQAPRDAAAMYEQNLRRFFDLAPGAIPAFDVVLLGMGDDGHTASLFPDTEALSERQRLCVANEVPQLGTTRITVTYPVLNAARSVLVLAKGESKAERLAEVLGADATRYPIERVRPEGEMLWLLDEAAASELPEGLCQG